MTILKKEFGCLSDGETAHLFTIRNENMAVVLTDYGAAVTSILLPDGAGGWTDVVLGYSTLSGYTENKPYFGVTVGRYANRIANGRFCLDGREYSLERNDGENHLHGGTRGFDKYVWESKAWKDRGTGNVRFRHRSRNGDEGYPGNLEVEVLFTLSRETELKISYSARADAPTPVNLTNHSYFNLKGQGRGDILDHEVRLFCPRFVPVDRNLIPKGELRETAGTPFDFTVRKPIRRDIAATNGGYDHCFVVARGNAGNDEEEPCAEVLEPESGRTLKVRTTSPGVQFYTGNFLNGVPGKRGSVYDKHAGFCLETGHFPDSPNQAGFPDCVLRPGKPLLQTTTFSFGF